MDFLKRNYRRLAAICLAGLVIIIAGCNSAQDKTASNPVNSTLTQGLPEGTQNLANPIDSLNSVQLPNGAIEGFLPGKPPSEYPDAPPIPSLDGIKGKSQQSMSANVGGISGWTIVQVANGWLGVPYRYGGNSRSGIDCSHLVYQVYGGACINYPYFSTAQMKTSGRFICVNPAPGDIITFRGLAHCGVYVGNGWMIDANSYYGRVMYDYIYSSYWQQFGPYAIRFIG